MAFDLSTAKPVSGGFDLSTAKPVDAQPSAVDQLLHTAKNVYGSFMEPAAAMASGAVAKPVSDLAGLAAIPLHAAGMINQDPADVKSGVQNAMTYSPRTEAGQQAAGMIGKAADATIGDAGRFAGNYYGGAAKLLGAPDGVQDAVRNGMQEFTNQVPGLMGVGGKAPTPKVPAINEATAQTLQDTHGLGIRVTPEYAGMRSDNPLTASNIASVSGSETKLQQALSKYNAQVAVPKVIKDEAGIPADQPLTQAALDSAKAKAEQMYAIVRKQGKFIPDSKLTQDMGGVGVRDADATVTDLADDIKKLKATYTPKTFTVDASTGQTASAPIDASTIVSDVRQLRADARTGFKSQDPKTVAYAQAQQQVANALDSFLQRQLAATSPGVGKAFLAARTQLAKLHSINDAFNEANGTVDLKSITRDADNGVPLSGGLLKLANAYKAFPKVLQDPAKINVGSESMVDKALQVGGILHGHPLEIAAGVARPFARAVVNTDKYQEGMVNPQLGTLDSLLASLRQPPAGP